MLPPKRIVEEAKRGTLADAQGMGDAVGEVGNLLTGTWDRIFRDELDGHKHFRKLETFIGDPWSDPSQVTGLADAEEFHFILYEVTVESYASFKCAALLPTSEAQTSGPTQAAPPEETVAGEPVEEVAPVEESVVEEVAVEQSVVEEAVEIPEAPVEEVPIETVEESVVEAPPAAEEPPVVEEPPAVVEESPAAAVAPAEEVVVEEVEAIPEVVPVSEPEPPVEDSTPAPPVEEEVIQEVTPVAEEPAPAEPQPRQKKAPVAETPATSTGSTKERGENLPKPKAAPKVVTAPSPAPVASAQQDPGWRAIMSLTALQVMGSKAVWVSPNDSVNEVLTTMQQNDVGYVLVGQEGKIHGLVSKSNVLGAMSPYLRPVFSKWRRPADDATLDIKVQWIMSRPVRTVQPQASLVVVVEQMRQFGGRCLPVVAGDGSVLGIVTVFDILRVLTPNLETNLVGTTPQAPCLMV